MSDAEKQLELENFMRSIAGFLDEQIKIHVGKYGFILILFEFESKGISNYISNASMPDVVKALRESADTLEAGKFIPTSHGTIQ